MNTNDRTQHGFLSGPEDFEITDEKFKELFDNYRQMIEETSIGLLTSIPPSLCLHFRQFQDGMPGDVEGAIVVIGYDFGDGDKKRKVMEQIGAKCLDNKWILVAAFMAAECWMSTRSKDDPNFELPPSKDPNRKEAIAISGKTAMGECKIGCMIPIGRDKDNKFIKDGEMITFPDGENYLLDHIFIGFRKALAKYLGHK